MEKNNEYGVYDSKKYLGCFGLSSVINAQISAGVCNSDGVDNSRGIYDSACVYGGRGINLGREIYRGAGINNSRSVSYSAAVNLSSGVDSSNGVDESEGVYMCNGVYNCYGVRECEGISKSIFCYKTTGTLLLFNKEISEKRFEQLKKQFAFAHTPRYNNARKLSKVGDWGKANISNLTPVDNKTAWADFPKEWEELARSLPEFDEEIFNKIIGE